MFGAAAVSSAGRKIVVGDVRDNIDDVGDKVEGKVDGDRSSPYELGQSKSNFDIIEKFANQGTESTEGDQDAIC